MNEPAPVPDYANHSVSGLIAEIERLRAALQAVVNCDAELDLTPYDYMHNNDRVRAVIERAKAALAETV